MDKQIIFEKRRDLRLVTIRRCGTLNDSDHGLIAKWAADCAQHVLHLFEEERPDDDRPRIAIEQARAWARGEITTGQARSAVFAANAASRETTREAKEAARAAGKAVAVAHMAAHEFGPQPMGSGLFAQPLPKIGTTKQVARSSGGSTNSCPAIRET